MRSKQIRFDVSLIFLCLFGTIFSSAVYASVPILNVSKTEISFFTFKDGQNPDPNIINITNSGGGTLNWKIVDVNEVTFNPPTWLTVSPISGSLGHNESQLVTLSIDMAGLSEGRYSYSFEIIDPASQNSPQTVMIDLEVIGPILDISSNTFIFTANVLGTNPNNQILTVSNLGGGTVNWLIDTPGKPDWLTITPASGFIEYNESEPVTLSVDITGLTHGRYSYTFQVSDPGAQNSPQIVTNNLWITDTLYVPSQYPTIQAAIDASVEGDSIIVLPGTYYENIYFDVNDVILTSIDPTEPDIVAATIIDGNDVGSVVTFEAYMRPASTLQGFTITNGSASHGGGIYVSINKTTYATIANCSIAGNTALYGGGVYGCNGTIRNCLVMDNVANGGGGGLYDCDGQIIDCTIADNSARTYGGGMSNCDFGTISNCTITGNTAGWEGGGLSACHFGMISNCTITGNTAGGGGGGVNTCLYGTISNCIIWDNEADSLGNQIYDSSTPSHSCIQDWTGIGTGNISTNPLFADPNNSNYHLKSEYGRWDPNTLQWVYDDVTSPCIDAGDPASDWTGELWPHGGRVNMGAYGGTPQASMSPNPIGNIADLDHNDEVDVLDLELLSKDWLYAKYLLDTDLNRDGAVDIADYAEFAQQWLWVEP